MTNIYTRNSFNLIEHQLLNYMHFILFGIKKEFQKISNPQIIHYTTKDGKLKCKEIFLDIQNIQYEKEKFSIEECKWQQKTYGINLLLPIYFKKKNKIIKQNLFLGTIPLISSYGSFIITGTERTLINQFIKKAGIYYKQDQNKNQTFSSIGIISSTNIWTNLILYSIENVKKELFISIPKSLHLIETLSSLKIKSSNDFFEIPFYYILYSLGLNILEIKKLYNDLNIPLNIKNILSGKSSQYKLLNKILFDDIFGIFCLNPEGRLQINSKLNINGTDLNVTIKDILIILNQIILPEFKSENIDTLTNKKLRTSGDLLQYAFYKNKIRIENEVKNLIQKLIINSIKSIKSKSTILSDIFNDFFKSTVLSQLTDQINSLSTIVHGRKISLFGPNGLNKDHISVKIRDVHESQFGRVCPIETSEGQTAGLISTLTSQGRVSIFGDIMSPYALNLLKNTPIIYKSIFEEKNLYIGLPTLRLKARDTFIYAKQNYKYKNIEIKNIDQYTINGSQLTSLSTNLIPFLEHNDANRALMGANMLRQAVPLVYNQTPIVGTFYELIVAHNMNDSTKIFNEGQVLNASSNKIILKDFQGKKNIYHLKKNLKTNQNTIINEKSLIHTGEFTYSNQIITNSQSSKKNDIALGTNLLVAYMPWEGYNFEDAIVINENLILNDTLSSLHIEEISADIDLKVNKEILTKNLLTKSKFLCRNLNKNGIIKKGSYVYENDILLGRVISTYENNLPEFKLAEAILGEIKTEYHLKDKSIVVPSGVNGRVINIKILPKQKSSTSGQFKIIFTIAQKRKIEIGDKLAGRHGNKGIISKILSNSDMPVLKNGKTVDIILNPLGVPSRMNVGQLLEATLGLANLTLNKKVKIITFDEIISSKASNILVYNKTIEALKKNKETTEFNKALLSQKLLRDGRTSEFFDNPVTVGNSYIIKLIHLVEKKIHSRSIGPYTMITEQPLGGKAAEGGQRFGEMEFWALEAYGVNNIINELQTIKSDDINGRNDFYNSLVLNKIEKLPSFNTPESFFVLIKELNALGISLNFKEIFKNKIKEIDPISNIENSIYKNAVKNRENLFIKEKLHSKLHTDVKVLLNNFF